MRAAVHRTLKGGPHNGLRLKFWSDPPAFRYMRESEHGVYAPDAVYALTDVQQKTRTIKRYEYVGDTEDWNRERENRNRAARARRLEQLKREVLSNVD